MGLVGSNPTLSAKSSAESRSGERVFKKSRHYKVVRRAWATQAIAVAAFAALFGVVGWLCWHRLDPDFGWHLQTGRYILAHGIPAHDIFTYTAPNFPWIDHEWLSDVLIAWLYGLGGRLLVGVMFAAVWVGAISLAARRSWPVAALGVSGLVYVFFARPLAFTALLLAIEVVVWYRLPAKRWLLVPVFAIWANLHGGFALGLAVLTFLLVWERQWKWLWLLPASVLATFVNPYGPRLYVEIWRTLSDTKLSQEVTEWGPLPISIAVSAYILMALFAMLWQKTWRLTIGVMSLGLLIAGVASARQYLPFVIMSLPLIAESYQLGLNRLKRIRAWLTPLPAIITLGFLIVLFVRQLPVQNYYPLAVVASLKQKPCAGHIFNNYDFGGYMEWQLPGVKEYIDGRMPSWRGPDGSYLERYNEVLKGRPALRTELTRYNITCAVLYNNSRPMAGSLQAMGWRAAARDDVATLWRRPGD